MNTLSIPFHAELFDGFAETKGFLKIQADHLHVEYETRDALFGVVKTAIKTLEISYQDIGDVQYKSNWFRTKIVITVSSLEAASALGNGSADVQFSINRKNKHTAEDFVDNLRLYVAEHQLKLLEGNVTDDTKLLDN